MGNIIKNFNQIAHNYRAIFCDLWGCIHNGRESFKDSLEALLQFRNTGGRVILVTNAPRPSTSVIGFLDNLGITNRFYDSIVTSGDTTKTSLQTGEFGYDIYHIGPKRDLCFFDPDPTFLSISNKINLVSIANASSIVCTGLFNDQIEKPSDYAEIIEFGVENKLPLLCANPDIQVDYGSQRLWCAGAIAEHYAKAGGESIYFGKPHKPIYDLSMSKLLSVDSSISKKQIICIGDGLFTDIRGGISYGLDTLFVAGGLSGQATGVINGAKSPNQKKLNQLFNKYKLNPSMSIGYFQ